MPRTWKANPVVTALLQRQAPDLQRIERTHSADVEGSFPKNSMGYVTKFTPHQALKLIA